MISLHAVVLNISLPVNAYPSLADNINAHWSQLWYDYSEKSRERSPAILILTNELSNYAINLSVCWCYNQVQKGDGIVVQSPSSFLHRMTKIC